MTCYHPLRGFILGVKENGKKDILVKSSSIDYIWRFVGADSWNVGYGDPDSARSPNVIVVDDYIDVPCGKCIGCRLAYSRDWANRCMLEAKEHEHNYFITLTYDDEHLPISHYIDENTGELCSIPTLRKRDLTLFYKRLRKRLGYDGIRYFSCGEYGDTTYRPHYHAIMFNLELPDLKFYKNGHVDGTKYYTSELLNSIWQNGYVIIGDVTWDSCAYVARYVMKKRKGKDSIVYEKYNITPPYVVMSRRPGIAANYYNGHYEEIYDCDELILSTDTKSILAQPPKYFDRLLEQDFPEIFKNIKDVRQLKAKTKKELKLAMTSVSSDELLRIEEDEKARKILALQRPL